VAVPETEASPFDSLSDRERQVVGLAAAGLVDKQIGLELDVTLNTLRTYWNRIREKVGDSSRPALVAAYVAHDLASNLSGSLDPLAHEGWVMDTETRTILATDTINDDHGLERGVAHPALTYARMTHPDDVERVKASIFDVADGNLDNVHLVFRMITPRGVEVVNASVYGIKDQGGRVRKVYGFRVRALDCRPGHDPTIQIGHWERTHPDEAIRIDESLARIIGRPEVREISFRELETMLFPDEMRASLHDVESAIAEGRDRTEGDLRFLLPDGEVVWARITRRLVHQPSGVTVYGTLAVFR
jgi:DNA-binding CsgD family transcriptional regulator/PAS domain-containing protein